jgi:hypothetical protein
MMSLNININILTDASIVGNGKPIAIIINPINIYNNYKSNKYIYIIVD